MNLEYILTDIVCGKTTITLQVPLGQTILGGFSTALAERRVTRRPIVPTQPAPTALTAREQGLMIERSNKKSYSLINAHYPKLRPNSQNSTKDILLRYTLPSTTYSVILRV